MFRLSQILDFQFNTVDQCIAKMQPQTGVNDPMLQARKDLKQVDFEFSNSRQTFAKITETTGLKEINPLGKMTDYEEMIRRDPPMFKPAEIKMPDVKAPEIKPISNPLVDNSLEIGIKPIDTSFKFDPFS